MGNGLGGLIVLILLAPLYVAGRILIEGLFELTAASFKSAGDGNVLAIGFCLVILCAVLYAAREFVFGCLGCLGTVVFIIALIALL